MKYQNNEYKLLCQCVSKNIMRCTITKADEIKNKSLIIQEKIFDCLYDSNDDCSIKTSVEDGRIVFTQNSDVLLNVKSYVLSKIDVIKHSTLDEEPIVEVVKTVDGERSHIKNLKPYKARSAYMGKIELDLTEDTGVFGLGHGEDGAYNRRGTKYYMYQHNMRIPMPLMMTDKGYGVLFDCTSLMVFEDTKDITEISFDTVDQIDFYVIAGDMDEIISSFRYLTGKAEMLPKWAFGYIQSQERYHNQYEMVDTVKKYREIGVPIDCIVQDWKTWYGDQWGQKTVDKDRFPDITKMNQQLHDMNVHSMVSIWPNMAADCPNHIELAKSGHLLGDYSTYNAFDEDARTMYWNQAEKELFNGGFDSWWCDSTEPFTAPDWCGENKLSEQKRFEIVGDEHKKFLDPAEANFYAVVHAKGIYENQRNSEENKRVLNLTRSGYAGIQKYGTVLWAGDASAKWSELKAEIAKGLNMSMSGIPFWTVDIGAFFVGGLACWRKFCGNEQAKPVWFWDGDYDDGNKDPAYRELYTRWLQFGAFLPIFRSHGTDTQREIWNFGEKGEMFYDSIEKFINLRYQLMPYIYSIATKVLWNNGTIMRSLLFDFSYDKKVKEIDDQYMFGDALMVCPVIKPMYYDCSGQIDGEKTKTCYLPKDNGWYDFWTNKYYEGGQQIASKADISTMPLFVKAGSILVMQKPVQHVFEKSDCLDVAIFKGRDAVFDYYNDDGISFDFKKGNFEHIMFKWCEQEMNLYISEVNKYRKDPIKLQVSCGDDSKEVIFRGEELVICFKQEEI